MIITTTPAVQGRDITHYHGVVVGRSAAYERESAKAREIAFEE